MPRRNPNEIKDYPYVGWLLKKIPFKVVNGVEQQDTYETIPKRFRYKLSNGEGLSKETRQLIAGFLSIDTQQVIESAFDFKFEVDDLILHSKIERDNVDKYGIKFIDYSMISKVFDKVITDKDSLQNYRRRTRTDKAYVMVIG